MEERYLQNPKDRLSIVIKRCNACAHVFKNHRLIMANAVGYLVHIIAGYLAGIIIAPS